MAAANRLFGSLCVVVVFTGCASRPLRSPVPEADEIARPAPEVVPETSAMLPPDLLTMVLEFPHVVQTGEDVHFKVVVMNPAQGPVRVRPGGRPESTEFDIVITRPDGSLVWNKRHGEFSDLIYWTWILGAGEAIRYQTTWDQRDNHGRRVRPGRYTVHVLLPTDPADWAASAERCRGKPLKMCDLPERVMATDAQSLVIQP